jgi:hypothetical protein
MKRSRLIKNNRYLEFFVFRIFATYFALALMDIPSLIEQNARVSRNILLLQMVFLYGLSPIKLVHMLTAIECR